MAIRDLTSLLSDSSSTWVDRRTHLQGWRGDDAACAAAAPLAQRIAPAVCATGAGVGAALESPAVLALFATTAAIGAVAPNHPFEALYNRWARGHGGPLLPPNRAAKRLGCVMGVAFLGSAAVAYAIGAATAGFVLALVLGGTAAFVAITGICVPSMVFMILWGAERASAPRLFGTPPTENANVIPSVSASTPLAP